MLTRDRLIIPQFRRLVQHIRIEAFRMALKVDMRRPESQIRRCKRQNLHHSVIQFIHCKHDRGDLLHRRDEVHQRHAALQEKCKQRYRIKMLPVQFDLFTLSGKRKKPAKRNAALFLHIFNGVFPVKPLVDPFSFT